MKSNIAARKLSEAKKQLHAAQKEQDAAHSASHARDTHSLDRGDSHAGVKVVGGYENKSSRGTFLQKKLASTDNDTFSGNPKRTMLQKKLATMPSLFKE